MVEAEVMLAFILFGGIFLFVKCIRKMDLIERCINDIGVKLDLLIRIVNKESAE